MGTTGHGDRSVAALLFIVYFFLKHGIINIGNKVPCKNISNIVHSMELLKRSRALRTGKFLLTFESKAENLVSKIRFTLASLCAILSLFLFSAGRITFGICSVQIGLLTVVCVYSGIFLFESRKDSISRYVAYIVSFFDIAVVTVFIWTLYIAGFPPKFLHSTSFPFYFILISFTAFHSRETLSFFTGFVSIYAYFILYLFIFLSGGPGTSNLLTLYLPGMVMLLIATFLSVLVARNNNKSAEQVTAFETNFMDLGSSLPLMLFKIDRKGRFLWVNIMSQSLFCVSSEDLLGQDIRDFIEDSETLVFTDLPVQGTFRLKKFGNEIKYVDCIIKASDGDRDVCEGRFVDVTDRERAIQQREEMEQRLFQFQKMESLGTLASGMAHDFNNILQTVTDISDRVSNKSSEPETKRGMALIAETLTDARFLISELLALGRKKPLNYNPVNVPAFLRESVPVFSRQLGELYEVHVNILDENVWIQGDSDYLKRVLQNLFGNAKDAMPEGGIISIECQRASNASGDTSVIIRFSDTGIGVPESIREKIFDPFYTTKKKGKGTGLGLALVRRIITQHKGTISVENAGLKGTTFRIEIPESEDFGHDIDTKTIILNRTQTTVLILDDDPRMCNILSIFLSEFSYKTCVSSTMDEGLKELQDHLDDCRVLIMDWKLKEKDPHEVISRFRDIKPELIIIVVSGYQPEYDSMKKMNIFRWITKPYDKNRLDLEIQKALYLSKKIT